MKVFITDADYKHTLGAVRTLGKRGIYVIAGSSSKRSQSFYSNYCKKRVVYPDPRKEEGFINFMLNYVKNNEIDVLLPIGYLTTTVLSKHKDKFAPYVRIPIANYDSMKIASDKYKTMEFAKNLGVEIPEMFDANDKIETFPVVIKGLKESGRIRYANSFEELSELKTEESIVQEYIPGEGYGFFALFNKGKVRAIFMHKRVREYPITGGPSTVAESIYDEKIKEPGLKLLESLNWHGVAMVEFKKDFRDGKFKLMEINPKFWGSLDLATASGVDFPYLTVKMAVDGDVEPVFEYETGIKFRWLFPDDFLHLLAKPSSAKFFIADFFDKNTKHNIWLSDIKPNLFQVYETSLTIISRIKNRNLKCPHGKPEVIS
jgi:predicted ATP-grasp superfamily ATP-dependent carboligase